MAERDQILNLLDSLPIPGMELGIKVLVFSFLLAVILAIIFAWLTTRSKTATVASTPTTHSRTTVLNLTHPKDKIVKLQSELIGVKHAKNFIKDAEADELISNSGILKIQKYYDAEITQIEAKLHELGYTPSSPTTEEEDELEDITKDLESRLSSDNDFYSTPTPNPNMVPAVPEAQTPLPSASSVPTPAVPTLKAVAPPKTSIPTPASIPSPTKPAATPAPVTKASIPAPTKVPVPKPGTPTKVPVAKPRVPTSPVAPVAPKVSEKADGDKFAKTTSIAALRSDMLRELAKLKQYIDEGDN